ncbi:MAG: NAD(P)-binding domain-containing protein [Candidatus Thiodiazotropha sp. (ex Dulcina madagascariensis)]|nr:NAD(P)-binding domain-containing protein [Candidatus Thiodiazotropha sp. (ex Dulcina madagascariensis)]
MRIGVLGTGDMGRMLAAGFAGCGHEVMSGTRDPGQQKIVCWLGQTDSGISAGTFAESAAFGKTR